MSFTLRNHFTLLNCNINSPKSHFESVKFCIFSAPKPQLNPLNFQTRNSHFQKFPNRWAIRVKPLEQDDGMVGWRRNNNYSANKEFNFDAFLSILEFLSLASSAVISVIIFAVNYSGHSGSSQRSVLGWFGNRVLVWQWQLVGLAIGVVLGAVIRRRQWRRICSADFSRQPVNLVERIEKLEEDLKSSTTIIRVLSRQLEKLGIRFRVTRKALKEPIAETAALAQKNSEATRALAAQEDNLEKELGEIQKVLLAMQEQQQKQLELILAIATSGKLWDNKREQNHDDNDTNASNSQVDRVPQVAPNQVQAPASKKEASSDQV